jgi:hypothetical protein
VEAKIETNDPPVEPSPVREQFGFQRTVCACEMCRAYCRHVPGSLDVADLARLCPPGQDLFRWAEEHLRARTDKPFPLLVPARQSNGHCHWLFNGQCAVHGNAPYSCAFFDSHMADSEANRRYAATVTAVQDDKARQGPYYRVWQYLCKKGLIGVPADWDALTADMRRIGRRVERNRLRLE